MIERVHFEKPLLKQLNAEGYKCVDMHCHTQYSDTYTRISNILKKCSRNGLGVAITDHNEIKGCLDAEKKNRKHNVLIIPGMEVSCLEGPHFLVYFHSTGELKEYYDNVVKRNLIKNPHLTTTRLADLIESTEKYNCMISAAHPLNVSPWNLQKKIEKGRCDDSILRKIPCFEVINGLMARKMNLKAMEWARECDKCITGGSDSHTLKKMGSVVTCSKADDIDSFLKSILKKENIVVGKETKTGFRVISNMKSISKHTKYAGCSLKFHYDHRVKGKIKPKIMEKIENIKEKIL
ncbi:histidinol-phosphatase [Candidatus Woesearchaeota archaeon CG10_big_fil_rev_8_21_14_0_10_44_13]|nr:MAG: histidinol-phosphatase [Candidatus Woesearchaeota archaeon CG10_big_fil_rev_8_21_14_0_10_44_13]